MEFKLEQTKSVRRPIYEDLPKLIQFLESQAKEFPSSTDCANELSAVRNHGGRLITLADLVNNQSLVGALVCDLGRIVERTNFHGFTAKQRLDSYLLLPKKVYRNLTQNSRGIGLGDIDFNGEGVSLTHGDLLEIVNGVNAVRTSQGNMSRRFRALVAKVALCADPELDTYLKKQVKPNMVLVGYVGDYTMHFPFKISRDEFQITGLYSKKDEYLREFSDYMEKFDLHFMVESMAFSLNTLLGVNYEMGIQNSIIKDQITNTLKQAFLEYCRQRQNNIPANDAFEIASRPVEEFRIKVASPNTVYLKKLAAQVNGSTS